MKVLKCKVLKCKVLKCNDGLGGSGGLQTATAMVVTGFVIL